MSGYTELKDECAVYKRLMSAYIDEETNQWETRALTEHIATCQSCKRELANLYVVKDMIKSCHAPKGEVDLSSNIMARIKYCKSDNKVASRKDIGTRAYAYGIVAALLLLAISSTVFYSQTQSDTMVAEKCKFDTYVVEHVKQYAVNSDTIATASVISANFEK